MHAVASNHTDVIQEAGWQFEFEIRESALIKLQLQLQEDVPAPPVGPEVRAASVLSDSFVYRHVTTFLCPMKHGSFANTGSGQTNSENIVD
jgi:hypothetical protein